MKYILLGTLCLTMYSCVPEMEQTPLNYNGLKPVYSTIDDLENITSEEPRIFQRVGKIYQYGQYIYVSDKGTGVHVIDNSDPANPEKIAFISIPQNFDMLSRLGALYADNGTDLVTIDISNLAEAHEVMRIENVYEGPGENYPPFYNGFFECVDPLKGTVIDWEEASLTNPQCRR